VTDFNAWFQELLKLAAANDWPVEDSGGDRVAWALYYEDGYTPLDALMEDMSYGNEESQ
jgi:hypothetical protein